MEKYDEFREWELDNAIRASEKEMEEDKFSTSLKDHFEELEKTIDA